MRSPQMPVAPQERKGEQPIEEWRANLSAEAKAHIEELERVVAAREEGQEKQVQQPELARTETENARAEKLGEVLGRLATHEAEPRVEIEREKDQREHQERQAAVQEAHVTYRTQLKEIEEIDEKKKRAIGLQSLGIFSAGAAITSGAMVASVTSLGVSAEAVALGATGAAALAPWVLPAIAVGVSIGVVGAGGYFAIRHSIRTFNKWRKEKKSDSEYRDALQAAENR